MYQVPMDLPKHCNHCPFGMCCYSHPSGKSTSKTDRKENPKGTYGYNCNIEFAQNGRYTKVMRAKIGEDIKKPKWCGLMERK